MKGSFDNEKFYASVDAERVARRLTWKQVAEQSGVNASTLTRMAQGKRPDVDGLAALLKWAGLKEDSFIDNTDSTIADPLSQMTVILRGDRRLSSSNRDMLESVLKTVYGQIDKQG